MEKKQVRKRNIVFIIVVILSIIGFFIEGIIFAIEIGATKANVEKQSVSNWAKNEEILRDNVGEDVLTNGKASKQYFQTEDGKQFLFQTDVENLKNGNSLVRAMLIEHYEHKFPRSSGVFLACRYNVKFELDTKTKGITNKKIGDLVLNNIDLGILANGNTKFDYGSYYYNENRWDLFSNDVYVYAPEMTFDEAKKLFKDSSVKWNMGEEEKEKNLKLKYDTQYGVKKENSSTLFVYELNITYGTDEKSVTTKASFDIVKAGTKISSCDFSKSE